MKPELLVTPKSLQHIEELIEVGADAFIIGEQQFGLRLAGQFTRQEVATAVQLAHAANKKVYVAVNALFHNESLTDLQNYIEFCYEIKVDALVFGDPAVITIVRELGIDIPLQWDTHTTGTNYFVCNYWGQKGATRAVLAKELTLEEIVEIKENANVEIEVQVHGMLCMFQSKRKLLGNYFMYQDKAMLIERYENTDNLVLFDNERDNRYPIFEDVNGTHIMSPADLCGIEELEPLFEANIDSFKIDGILHSQSYITAVTDIYRQAIDTYYEDPEAFEDEKYEWYADIEVLQPELRPLDTGFFFKATMY